MTRLNETLEKALTKRDALNRVISQSQLSAGRSAVNEFHESPGNVGNVAHFRMLLQALRVPSSVIEAILEEEAAQHEGAKKWYFTTTSVRSRA